MDAESHADRALEMYGRGRWAEAESELRKALALNPDQPEWHYNLGLTLEASGREVEAIASYQRAVELAPDRPEALLATGVVCARLGRTDEALVWFERALELDHASETALAQKIDALARLGRHDEAEVTFYLALEILASPSAPVFAAIAESLIDREEFGRAEWCLKEAMRLEPGMPRLRARLASVFASTDRSHRALQLYVRELRDDPGNLDTLLDFGELLLAMERLAEAGEKFRRVLEVEPANVDAHFRLGQVAMKQKSYDAAHVEFELVYRLDPGFPEIRLALAEALLARGESVGARSVLADEYTDLRGAAEGVTWTAAQLDRLGGLLLETAQAQMAIDVLERAVASAAVGLLGESGAAPGSNVISAATLRRLAAAYFLEHRIEEGARVARRVLRVDPRCVVSMHNLALAAMRRGQLQIAHGWIARGLRVDRHDAGLRRLRAQHWMQWARTCCSRVLFMRAKAR